MDRVFEEVIERGATVENVDRTRQLPLRNARSGGEERVLVEAARRGDEQAFAVLVGRYGQPILSLCYSSTLDAFAAEDLTQEVFLAAWRGLSRFRGDSTFSTWLFALARNACIDKARRAAVRPRLVGAGEEIPDAVDPHDTSTRETATALVAATARLTLPLRQALLLRDVQGLTYEEIATLQRVPIGTVRSRIAAARSTLAQEFG